MRAGGVLVLLGVALAACSRANEPQAAAEPAYVVLSQVPRGRPAQSEAETSVAPGGRVVLADLAHPERGVVRILSVGFDAAGEAGVSHDGKRVCFVGRRTSEERWSIYATTLDGDAPERVTSVARAVGSPAWLPDGRIVYSAEVGPPAYEQFEVPVWALYVVPAGGGPGERIGFSDAVELDPSVLSDGRIVYVGWQAGTADDPSAGCLALFTVHPDGTGVTLFHGDESGAFHARPRQARDGTVYSVRRPPTGRPEVAVTDWRAPLEPGRTLPTAGTVAAVEPLADGVLLAVVRDATTGVHAVRRLAADGTPQGEPVFDDPDWETVLVADATPRPRPQGHLSTIDVRKEYGSLLAVDTYAHDVEGAVAARLKHWVREFEDGAAVLASLGDVPLEEDGSFFVRVPPDVPLIIELLDEAGNTLKAQHTPIWVRPNEIRGCTGCHDPADTTPPNRRPLAVARDPVFLRGEAGEGGTR